MSEHTHNEIQRLVDQAASFNLFSMPDSRAPAGPIYLPGNSGKVIGIEASQTIRRFDIELDLPTINTGVRAANQVGPPAGRLDFRWMIAPHEFLARPDREPPPTPFDPLVSQRIVMQEGVFTFGDGSDGLRSFGSGRTFPMLQFNGQMHIQVAAVGVFTQGFGRLRDCEGNFTVTGQFSPEGSFTGNFMMRILDFSGRLRTSHDLPPVELSAAPDSNVTFLTWIAQKSKTPDQENTFSIAAGGQVRGLNIPVALKRVQLGFAAGGHGGISALDLRTGEVIGREIGFGRESAPRTPFTGTPLTPYQFEGVSRYTFYDPDGRALGAFTANVVEGRSMNVRLPGAESEPALRFGYFGPIIEGFGCFAGVRGFLCGAAGSVFAPPPADHVISNMYVARLIDPRGEFRIGKVERKMAAPGGGSVSISSATVPAPTPAAPLPAATTPAGAQPQGRAEFLALVKKTNDHTADYKRWRNGFRNCSGPFSKALVEKYNELSSVGDFPDLPMDANNLKSIFEAPIKPFDPETFERYQGPARGVFTFYDLKTHKPASSSVLYSFWDYKTPIVGERHYKQISGSEIGYYEPDKIPHLSERKVDIIANAYRPDVGVTSFVDIYQHVRQQRTSIAYKLPHPHEVLWFVKDLFRDDQNLEDNNVFMASHEWKGTLEGRVAFFMVGIFFHVDFETCSIHVSGDQFWRGLYIAEPK